MGSSGSPSPFSAAFCADCGQSVRECSGCGRALDPPRFCPECGRRMTVTVIPTGWVARCRDHAELRSA
jgi:predicted amidophosphoribosyltransferase